MTTFQRGVCEQLLAGITVLTLAQGCSEQTETPPIAAVNSPAQSSSAGTLTPLPDVVKFDKRAPNDLVSDEKIGRVIRSLVPQGDFKCMDEIFNLLSDLELKPDGYVIAIANGSHADNFAEGLVTVSKAGAVHIVLNCDGDTGPIKKYRYYTNEGIKSTPPGPVKNWLYTVASPSAVSDTIIVKSDGKTSVDTPWNDLFAKEELARAQKQQSAPVQSGGVPSEGSPSKKAQPEVAAPATNRGRTLPAGTVVCSEVRSFYKVNAIERTGNNYVPLPDTCLHIADTIPVTAVRNFGDPIVGDVVLIAIPGAQAYVREKDLR